MTKVEEYLKYKGWNYRINGDQAQVETCPFCQKDDFKFYINLNTFMWDCKRASCGRTGGEWVIKKAMNDGDQLSAPQVTNLKESGNKQEGVPNVDKMHENLVECQSLLNWLQDQRGWSKELIARQKIGLMDRYMPDIEKEVPCFAYPYFTGKACNFVKFRSVPSEYWAEPGPVGYKGFSALKGRDVPLYNQNCLAKDMEYLLIVEGEADTISVLGLGEDKVVGVPGAGLKKVIWDRQLTLPKKKYILFDNDQAGQQGAKSFAERFGVEQFYNIVLPEFELLEPIEENGEVRTKGKDISEWVAAGGTLKELKQFMQAASMFNVDGVCTLIDALDEAEKELEERGTNQPRFVSPWGSLNAKMGGAELGHLVIFQAHEKFGKTKTMINWGDHIVEHQKAGVYFECVEMKASELAAQWAAFKTRTPSTMGKSLMTPEIFRKAKQIAREREHALLFGFYNYTDKKMSAVFDRWTRVIRQNDSQVIISDNLQAIINQLGRGEARHEEIARFSDQAKAWALEHKRLVILVAQSKRRTDGSIADANTLEGSGSPAKSCDCMIIGNRVQAVEAKKEEDLKRASDMDSTTFDPVMYLEVGRSRYTGGGRCRLYLEGEISLIRELEGYETSSAAVRNEVSDLNFHSSPTVTAPASLVSAI